MLSIPLFPDLSDYEQVLSLEGVSYRLRLRWIDRTASWYADLAKEDGTSLVRGCRLSLGYRLFGQTVSRDMPPGTWIVVPMQDDPNKLRASETSIAVASLAGQAHLLVTSEGSAIAGQLATINAGTATEEAQEVESVDVGILRFGKPLAYAHAAGEAVALAEVAPYIGRNDLGVLLQLIYLTDAEVAELEVETPPDLIVTLI